MRVNSEMYHENSLINNCIKQFSVCQYWGHTSNVAQHKKYYLFQNISRYM